VLLFSLLGENIQTYYLPPVIKFENFEFIFGFKDFESTFIRQRNTKLMNQKIGGNFLTVVLG